MSIVRRAALAVVLGAGFGAPAVGQIIDHVGRLEGAPVVEEKGDWKGLIKQEDPHRWVVEFRVRGYLAPPGATDGEVLKHAGRGPRLGVFCVPWVDRSPTQVGDERTLSLDVSINGAAVTGRALWLESPKGMERLRALEVEAPPGTDMPFAGNGDGKHEELPVLLVDLAMSFEATAYRVSMDERQAGLAKWPAQWPAAAEGALKEQVFRETGVDPETRLVRELDDAALSALAVGIAKDRGIKDPRTVSPLKVIKEVAAEVSRRVSYTGDGLVPCADAVNMAPVDGVGGGQRVSGAELAALNGAFEGIEVRDALTVLRSRKGNAAERAVALAAVYRKLGVPCRVIVAFEASPNKDKKLTKKLGDAARREKGQRSAPVVEIAGAPEARFWVEAALWDSEAGLGWVPVDLGKGGSSAKVGSVDGSEKLVVLATNFWPPSIRVVGAKVPCGPSGETVSFGWWSKSEHVIQARPDGKGLIVKFIRFSSGTTGPQVTVSAVPRRMFDLAAGMWGYWTLDQDCPTIYQQVGVLISRKPETGGR